ncbi:hypothetical protein WK55_22150 [Burkholderia ubonensis]|uniref:DUF2827 domain-containing protein n=1 Tax=Burkholderia ubonensis TaxID=101571 RepID=UPI000751BA1D|nr:DUF2827 domain-containing protein [Burkholderia ubonensis]KVT54038.1 hypothetical protein WK55_22150 [Burkholderia ubonensis]
MSASKHRFAFQTRGLRVGVSVLVRKAPQSLWSNGVAQNCLFLAMLLARVPSVESVYLVAGGGGGGPEDAKEFLVDAPAPLIDMAEAAANVDVMIEMGAQLDREWAVAFRERGGKIVSMRVGHDYVIDIERMMFDRPPGMLITGAPYHAVWTLPQYEKSGAPYLGSVFRAPVRILPHLWSPLLLERAAARLPDGRRFGYQPGRQRWRVGIFEPNVCMVKTSVIPLLCCEAAHRADPGILERVWVFNTFGLKEHPGFKSMVCGLDLVRYRLASFDQRFPFYDVMAGHTDAVVSHQWENAQNYLHYEALYGGYPLVHNSHLIGDCGYRYRAFDCVEGGRVLREAFAAHDANLDAYRRQARAFLRSLDPECQDNIRQYDDALTELFDASSAY